MTLPLPHLADFAVFVELVIAVGIVCVLFYLAGHQD